MTELKIDEKLSRRPDPDLPQAVAGARRVRLGARLSGLALAAGCAFFGGDDWAAWLLGAVLGALVVEANLSLLVRALARANKWRGRSLWPTLLIFYLAFAATAMICVLVIRNGWGQPLAFLTGLFSFLTGLVTGLVSLAVKPPPKKDPS